MSNITLADGLPVWEGAAVRLKASDGAWSGRQYVTGFSGHGLVHVHTQYNVVPGALVLDLDHTPTFMHLVYLVAEARGLNCEVEPGCQVIVRGFDDTLVTTITTTDDLRAFCLTRPVEHRK